MKLELVALDHENIRSSYRDGEAGFPARLAFLHPEAAGAFARMNEAAGGNIVLTDCWRSALISLQRKFPIDRPPRPGVQRPGLSAHNWGFAIDIDTAATLKRTAMTKARFDGFAAAFGWHCHRRDHKRGAEDWHFNALVMPGDWTRIGSSSTAPAVEAMIVATYGRHWTMTELDAQRALADEGFYAGELDGIWGAMSAAAAAAFQRAWRLKADGVVGALTGRLLALRAAEREQPLVAKLWTVTGRAKV